MYAYMVYEMSGIVESLVDMKPELVDLLVPSVPAKRGEEKTKSTNTCNLIKWIFDRMKKDGQ